MKQGKVYTRVILWIFLAAVVCYFGYYIFSALYAPLTTAIAMEYEAGTGSYTTGYVFRDENVIRSRHGITTMVVSEGERVSRGQTLAAGYLSGSVQNRQSRMEELESQLEQLEYAASYSADPASQRILDGEIQSQLVHMSRYVARRDMNSAADRSAALKGLILRRMASDEENEKVDQRIAELKEELETIRADVTDETVAVTAEGVGYFSGTVDGYERVLTPESVRAMTVTEFYDIAPRSVPNDAIGKLVSGSTWYYVTVVPTAQTREVEQGDQVPVSFASDFSQQELLMTVERLGLDEDGNRMLVLSCDKYMQDATLLRQQSADVVFSSYAGLQVPKEAIRVRDDGQPGVYVLEGNMAVWKSIRILYDNGESYVVERDKSSTDNLWPGDEIIVGARGLYNGKVVR